MTNKDEYSIKEEREIGRVSESFCREFFGHGNGSPCATNVVLVLGVGVVVIRFVIC